MDLSFIPVQILTGLASASSLFITASGLTLIFGVTRIVNFAHGSLYMLGAYLGVTFIPYCLAVDASLPLFLVGVLASALVVGILGLLLELVVLRRIYHVPELFQLLATFALVLIVQDLVVKLFGPADILGPRAPGLKGAVTVFGQRFPSYELFMLAMGPLVLGALHLLMRRTRYGLLVRAATQDREMVGALGVNQKVLFTATLCLGAFLAGLSGALQVPRMAASSHMDVAIISEAFVVTVIGGMGSITGAFLAAVLIGLLQAFGIVFMPKITLVLVFLAMGIVLILRPNGLLGRAETPASRVVLPEGVLDLKQPSPIAISLVAGLFLTLMLAPLVVDAYAQKLLIEMSCLALAAMGLQHLVSLGGIVSFGHAAWFGVGAYGAGLLVVKAGLPLPLALLAAPLCAAVLSGVTALFIVRLSGIYAAMLTLAVAQMLYAIIFQWVELTGGDNGLVGLWPPAALSGVAYYYLTVITASATMLLLYGLAFTPYGFALRASRDAPLRARAIGLDPARLRLVAFMISAAAAGLAGALYAFAKGSIDPSLLSIPQSVDFLAMLLLGGIQTLTGALVGAAALYGLKTVIMPLTDFWRLGLGAAIITVVLAAPRGLLGWRR